MGKLVAVLESKINEPLYSILISTINTYKKITKPERPKFDQKLTTGESFYLIDIDMRHMGLASVYDQILGQFKFHNNFTNITPVINVVSPQMPEINVFDCFWEQKYKVEDISESSCILKCNKELITLYKRINRKEIERRHEITVKLKLKDEIKEFIIAKMNDLKISSNTIGCYYRGTDYKSNGKWKPLGHARVPDIKSFCDEIEKFAISNDTHDIFFVTDEQEALDYASKRFSDYSFKYIYKKRFSKNVTNNYEYGKDSISDHLPEGIDFYNNNLLYLTDIYLLSECGYLMGTKNAGIMMALNLNGNKYKKINILDYGVTI